METLQSCCNSLILSPQVDAICKASRFVVKASNAGWNDQKTALARCQGANWHGWWQGKALCRGCVWLTCKNESRHAGLVVRDAKKDLGDARLRRMCRIGGPRCNAKTSGLEPDGH